MYATEVVVNTVGKEMGPPTRKLRRMRSWIEEKLRDIDPHLQPFTVVIYKLIRAFGDTVHQINNTQLHGHIGRVKNRQWWCS